MTNHQTLAERFRELAGSDHPGLPPVPTLVFTAAPALRQAPLGPLNELLARGADRFDGDNLHGAQPVLDQACRVGLAKVAASMGWDRATAITVSVVGPYVVLRVEPAPGEDGLPHLASTVRGLDGQGRLTLSPAHCLALGVTRGQQVQVIADPDAEQITLMSLGRALRTLVGQVAA